jgi:hypothetical protein
MAKQKSLSALRMTGFFIALDLFTCATAQAPACASDAQAA